MGNQELKPCPFCDCGAMMFHPGGIAVYRVGCPRCGVTTFTYDTREKAVAAWNRRTIPAAAAAEQLKAKDEKIAELLANHAAINTVLDRLEPKIERAGEQAKDVVALLEAKDKRITELEEHERKLMDDRRAYLTVKTIDGLTASEWVMRAGLAKQAQEKAEADRDRWHQAVDDLTAHLVRVCTAAGISTDADDDCLVAAFAALRERAAELEEQLDTRQALDELEAERDALRGRVAAMREAFQYMKENWFCHESCWGTDLEGRSEEERLTAAFMSDAGAPEAAVIKAAPDGLEEARDIIQRFYVSAFGRAVRNWETYAPKLTAALEAVERMREGRS